MKRLQFVKQHVEWMLNTWINVLFSDESKFNIIASYGITHVKRPRLHIVLIQYNMEYLCLVAIILSNTVYMYTRCDEKITVILKFHELRMVDFRIFFFAFLCVFWYTSLLYTTYVDNINLFELLICFWQIKRLLVFWCALRIYTIRKSGSKKLLSFV